MEHPGVKNGIALDNSRAIFSEFEFVYFEIMSGAARLSDRDGSANLPVCSHAEQDDIVRHVAESAFLVQYCPLTLERQVTSDTGDRQMLGEGIQEVM